MEAAENEGMPPRQDAGRGSSYAVKARRRAGSSGLGQSNSCARTNGPWSGKAELMIREKNPTRQLRARLIAKMAVVASVIASLAVPVFGQDGTGRVPENAQARSYGGGWVCDLGYRVDGADCVKLDIPDNAHATGRSYGAGWACRRGYEEVNGATCNLIHVPANAFLRSSGHDWLCERGYRQEREVCVPIDLPDHAYLTDDNGGSGWACDRGFTATTEGCLPIAVPQNGYLTNTDYGEEWACERGFVEDRGRCDAIVLPANAFLDLDTYGPGWRCARGYQATGGACIPIDLPENAHLDRSGNRWSCDLSFHLSDGACILGR